MIYPLWIGISLAVSFWLCSFIQPYFHAAIGFVVPETWDGAVWALTYALLAFFPFRWLYKAGMWFGENVLHVFDSPFSMPVRWFDGRVSYALFYFVAALLLFWMLSLVLADGLPLYAKGVLVWILVIVTGFTVIGRRGFFYGLAEFTAPLRRFLEDGRIGKGGSARFAGFLSEWTKPFWQHDDKLLLGKSLYGDLYVGSKLEKHFLTLGGTRGGKGVSAIIPNLNCWQDNIFCIDPKGENAAIMGRTLQAKVLDPYEIVENDNIERCGYNFVADIDTNSPDVVSQINTLLEAVIVATSTKDPFWDNASKTLFTGLVAHVCTHSDFEGKRDLVSVYDLCFVTGEAKEMLIAKMENNAACYGLASKAAAILRTPSKNTESGILVTLQTHLDFLKDPRIQKSVRGENTFSIDDLATERLNIFVCLPVDDIRAQKPWLRLMLMWCFRAMTRPKERRSRKLLFVMDEFHKLGWLPVIEEAAGSVAGYGIRLWPIAQDVGQLQKLYGDVWETFVSNASGVQFIAVTDSKTLDYIAMRLGRSAHKREALGGLQSGLLAERNEIKKILDPQRELMIVEPSGGDALVLQQCPYYKCMSSNDYDAPLEHRSSYRKERSDWAKQCSDLFVPHLDFEDFYLYPLIMKLRYSKPFKYVTLLVVLALIVWLWLGVDSQYEEWYVDYGVKGFWSYVLFGFWFVFFDTAETEAAEARERRQAERTAVILPIPF